MTGSDPHDPEDRRREDRHRTRLRGGILRSRDGRRLADCLIRDRSANGAKLVLVETKPLPLEMELEDEADHCRYPVRIIRRDGLELGVVVEQPVTPAS